MASELQRVAQGLVENLDQMPQVVAYLQRLAQKCRDNAMHIADFHSAQPAARNAALMLDEAARRCDEAADVAMRSHAVARTWAAQMVGDGSAGPSADAAMRAPTMHGSPPSPAGGPGQRAPTDPEATAVLDRLPVRAVNGRDKTIGKWLTADGDNDLESGYDGESVLADAIAKAQRIGRHPHLLFVSSHVEVKFAARMRQRGLRNESIVINNVPCEGEAGCDQLLEQFLPPGATLTVYGRDASGKAFKKTYHGKADLR